MQGSADGSRPKPGQVIEGSIEDLAYGGSGVLRYDGWVVMVRGGFPGDRLRVGIRRRRKGLLEADLLEILAPSPERVAPACPHLPLCGGCALQGLDPAAQTRLKAAQAEEVLRRIGKFEPAQVMPPWCSPRPYFYRNKMEFTFGARPWLSAEELAKGVPFGPGPALGLHPRGVFQGVFDVTDCQLQSPLSNRIVATVRAGAQRLQMAAYNSHRDSGLLRHLIVRQAATTSDLLVILVVRAEDPGLHDLTAELRAAVPDVTGIVARINPRRAMVATGDHARVLWGEPAWREEIAGLVFRIGDSAFFQTQTPGAQALIEEVLAVGEFQAHERVLDLYCGLGAFSLPIAQRTAGVLGVEISAEAVAAARENAAANGISKATFAACAVESRARQVWESPGAWHTIVVDPPRSGLHPRALEKLRGLAAPRIVYVSCNPATLARDAGILVNEDGYRARRLRVFDLFPQTPHLESVLLLERAT